MAEGRDKLVTTVRRDAQIVVPTSDREQRFAIRKSDWVRIQRQLKSCAMPSQTLAIVYSIFFGISASAALSIYPMAIAEGLSAWVLPTYVLTTIFSFIIALVFAWLDHRQQNTLKTQTQLIADDMKEIEQLFLSVDDDASTTLTVVGTIE